MVGVRGGGSRRRRAPRSSVRTRSRAAMEDEIRDDPARCSTLFTNIGGPRPRYNPTSPTCRSTSASGTSRSGRAQQFDTHERRARQRFRAFPEHAGERAEHQPRSAGGGFRQTPLQPDLAGPRSRPGSTGYAADARPAPVSDQARLRRRRHRPGAAGSRKSGAGRSRTAPPTSGIRGWTPWPPRSACWSAARRWDSTGRRGAVRRPAPARRAVPPRRDPPCPPSPCPRPRAARWSGSPTSPGWAPA